MFEECKKCGQKFNKKTIAKCPNCRELKGKGVPFYQNKNRISKDVKTFLREEKSELRKKNNRYEGLFPGQHLAR